MNNIITNNMLEHINLIDGMNLQPITLEAGNEITTTGWLMAMQKKLNIILDFTNTWYNNILEDLENNGKLFSELNKKIISAYGDNIKLINEALEKINSYIEYIVINNNKITQMIKPTKSIYGKDEQINSVVINITLENKDFFTKAEIYKNNNLLTTISEISGNSINYVDSEIITENTDYYVILYFGDVRVKTAVKTYKFIDYIYYGCLDKYNSDNVKYLTKTSSTIINNLFKPNNEKIIILFPKKIGNITKINHQNNNIIDGFTTSTIQLNDIEYTLIESNNLLKTEINLNFEVI